jgi:hypothetical protein
MYVKPLFIYNHRFSQVSRVLSSRRAFPTLALKDQVVHALADLELFGERPPER